jgi:predicted aspartyl protease
MVETGAVMNMLPQDVVEHLGVPIKDHAVITLADERREEMPVAAGVTFKLAGRSTTLPCLVGPPRSEALLGQVLLEVLDLVVDGPGKRVFPNPDSPIYPSLKLK